MSMKRGKKKKKGQKLFAKDRERNRKKSSVQRCTNASMVD